MKSNTEEFIVKASKVHGNKYDYSKSIYTRSRFKLTITCPIHGDFEQNANSHLMGNGCMSCGRLRTAEAQTSFTEDFILKANDVHDGKYLYDKVNYISAIDKVDIYCNTHKEYFSQSPNNHLSGQGCRKCGNDRVKQYNIDNPILFDYTNWISRSKKSKNFDSYKMYIIECWNDDETFFKIGKTYTTVKERYRSRFYLPYEWKIHSIEVGKAREICERESYLQRINKGSRYIPKLKFGGSNECFSEIIIK
jgi:hypothetical protein